MIKRILKKFINHQGYEIRRISKKNILNGNYVLYPFIKNDDSFDYEKYKSVQEEGNKRKLNSVWVLEENIAFLSDYLRSKIKDPKFGICHGTRRGKEQEWFSKYLGCKVIGTEISSTANNFPNTIQWDFHKAKSEWKSAADFIYSNSFDHTYDPENCLNTWISCIRIGGYCIIEHSSLHQPEGANQLDPFGADIVQMPYLITKWGNGNYGVRQILNAPAKNSKIDKLIFLMIYKFQ